MGIPSLDDLTQFLKIPGQVFIHACYNLASCTAFLWAGAKLSKLKTPGKWPKNTPLRLCPSSCLAVGADCSSVLRFDTRTTKCHIVQLKAQEGHLINGGFGSWNTPNRYLLHTKREQESLLCPCRWSDDCPRCACICV